MAFTVTDFNDLVKLLSQHPEWQAELRRLMLSGELEAAIQRAMASGTLSS